MKYWGKRAQAISFPVGGIGAGCIGIAGNGMLIDWEIKNRPNKCSNNGFSFFAVKAEKDERVIDARVLNGDQFTPYQGMPHVEQFAGYGFGPERCTLAGAPHFSACEFDGSYPYANISFSEKRFPGKPTLRAFNPFIPSNEDDSGIPAAFFTLEIENDTSDELDYIFAGSLQNAFADAKNAAVCADGLTCVCLDPVGVGVGDPAFGGLCLATDARDKSVQEYWFRGGWFDQLGVFWQDFTRPGLIKPRSYGAIGSKDGYPGTKDVCSITARVHAKPGEKKSVRFVISWRFPNYTNYWNPVDEAETGFKNTWTNYYAIKFPSARAAAEYALANWERLDAETRLFHDALASSAFPPEAIDAITGTMSVLKTPTCVRLPDGSFYGWEGLHSTSGSCEGTCTHVWNYAYALAFLFPRLERSLRETNYKFNQDPDGGMRFRTQIPLGRAYSSFRPCADGQFGDVLKTYREWKICGNNDWLNRLWPSVKRSVEYAWSENNPDRWDPNKDGVLEGRQHHTLDMELFGPSGWLNGFYLAALKAAAEMAEAMGDPDAKEFEKIYLCGREWVDKNLFNGAYYTQKVNLRDRDMLKAYGEDAYNGYWNDEAQEIKYQIGDGCSIDQVTAQWHANLIGLGDILDAEHVRGALGAIYKNNFKSMRDHFNPCRVYSLNDERGTVMCEWPAGAAKPVIPIPYAEETMYGFEYQAAVGMLQNGMIEEGLELVRAVRERHNGENRNPWNEMECGSNYARSMAAYSILIALSGFEYDMTRGYIGFAPRISQDAFRTFWSMDGAWGAYSQSKGKRELTLLYGSISIKRLKAGMDAVRTATVNGDAVSFKTQDGAIVFSEAVNLKKGDAIAIS